MHRTTLNRLSGSSLSPTSFNYTPYFYHIEILVPNTASVEKSLHNGLVNEQKLFKPKFQALSQHPVWLKFKFKIENALQVRLRVVVIVRSFYSNVVLIFNRLTLLPLIQISLEINSRHIYSL